MDDEMAANGDGDVGDVLNVGQQGAETDLHRKTDQRDGKVIRIVQIPSIFEDEIDFFLGTVDVNFERLDGVGDGGVEAEIRRSRVNEEGDQKGEEEDGGDGNNHVTRRPFRLQTLVGKWDEGNELIFLRTHVNATFAATSGAVDINRFLARVSIKLLIAPETL
jgi:hypothetical protein